MEKIKVFDPVSNSLMGVASDYIGLHTNPEFKPDTVENIAMIIKKAVGPSGPNIEYLFKLHKELEVISDVPDVHVEELLKYIKTNNL